MSDFRVRAQQLLQKHEALITRENHALEPGN